MCLKWKRLLPVLFCLHMPGDTPQCSTCYQTFRQHISHLDQNINQNVGTLWWHMLFQVWRHLEHSSDFWEASFRRWTEICLISFCIWSAYLTGFLSIGNHISPTSIMSLDTILQWSILHSFLYELTTPKTSLWKTFILVTCVLDLKMKEYKKTHLLLN